MEEKTVITAEKLCKTYGNGETEVKALDNVSFTADKGTFTAVTGTSGSGKSTLLHVLGGMDVPDSGSVKIGKEQIFPPEKGASKKAERSRLAVFRRRSIGFIFQSFNLVPIMTVSENITAPLMLDGRTPDPVFFKELTDRFEITARLDSYPAQLSGGQQQRVAIARALLSRPSVILADEPTGNLDTKNSRDIISLMKDSVRDYGQTLVLITHDPEIAAEADRVAFMTDGRLRF